MSACAPIVEERDILEEVVLNYKCPRKGIGCTPLGIKVLTNTSRSQQKLTPKGLKGALTSENLLTKALELTKQWNNLERSDLLSTPGQSFSIHPLYPRRITAVYQFGPEETLSTVSTVIKDPSLCGFLNPSSKSQKEDKVRGDRQEQSMK